LVDVQPTDAVTTNSKKVINAESAHFDLHINRIVCG
jgi:hypothetical protein